MSANKKKRRKQKRPTPFPRIPVAEIEMLRRAFQPGVVDPDRTYRVKTPTGIQEFTGLQALQTAKAMVDLADAERAGDPKAMREAILRAMRSL